MDTSIFIEILSKIIFLYSFILAGFVLGKTIQVKTDDIAKILIYFIIPAVMFFGVYKVEMNLNVIFAPIVLFCITTLVTFLILYILKFIRSDNSVYILSFMSGSVNVGYLGLPIAIFIFPPNLVSIYIFTIIGVNMCESIVGVFILSRGHFNIRDSLLKIFKIPILYATILGLYTNYNNFKIPEIILGFEDYFKYSYSLLGMLIIGIGLASIKHLKFDKLFILAPILAAYIVWPLIVYIIQIIDIAYFNFFNEDIYKIFYLMAIMPVAANSVAMASIFNYNVDKVSLSLVINTLIGLFYIHFMIYFLG